MNSNEKDVIDYYERQWSKFVKWWDADKTLGIHLGFYEKGINNHIQAVLNMNDFIGRLLTDVSNSPFLDCLSTK